jgi:hypothetical protein
VPYHFVLGPALLYEFGYGLLDQPLKSLAGIVAALVELRRRRANVS